MRKTRETNINLSNQQFGQWTVIGKAEPKKGRTYWNCRCDCGTVAAVSQSNLRGNLTTNCGCVRKQTLSDVISTHRKSGTHIYRTYYNMLNRCHNQKYHQFKDYGGRGISVCDRWRGENGFTNFLADLGNRPTSRHTIERIDVNGNYCPENVTWATYKEQAHNRRHNLKFTHDGVTKLIVEWAEEYEITPGALRYRLLEKKMPFFEAVNTPVQQRRSLRRSSE